MTISELREYLYKIESEYGDLEVVFDVDDTDNLYVNTDIEVLIGDNYPTLLSIYVKRENSHVY